MLYTFKKPARPVTRVFVHCSASDNPKHDNWATIDRWHRERGWACGGYHFFIRRDGTLEMGRDLDKIPAAQEGNNNGTITICLHGLKKELFREEQFATLRALCGQIDAAYGDDVTFHGHCEVSNKSCPVYDYCAVLNLDASGMMVGAKRELAEVPMVRLNDAGLEVQAINTASLKIGSKGDGVKFVQQLLASLGYFAGAIDGDFGARTRAAVMAFQADNHLIADGVFGALSREAIEDAKPRPVGAKRAAVTLTSLAEGGSRIAKASIGNTIIGTLLGGGGAVAVLDQLTGSVSAITGQANAIEALIAEHGLLSAGVILAAGAFVAWQSYRAGRARVDDHRTGKTA